MAPRATRSSGKIVIKPRTTRAGKGRAAAASTPTRPTIRIGPRATTRRDEPSDDDATVDEDEETELDDDGRESILMSNKGASTSRAQTADEDVEVKSEQDDNNQDVDVDVEEADDGEEVATPRDGDGDEENAAPVPRGRGRGRPRGKGRAGLGGSGTPRGRPRGRGKGRTKGRPSGRRRDRDEEPEIEIEEDENGEIRQFRTINGQAYFMEGDEYVIEGNPKGEAKIDANGNLLGGALDSWAHSYTGDLDNPPFRSSIQVQYFPSPQSTSGKEVHACY